MTTDPLEIVNEFTSCPPEHHPCPIDINDNYWLKKLCALAERCAKAENAIGKQKDFSYTNTMSRLKKRNKYLEADYEISNRELLILQQRITEMEKILADGRSINLEYVHEVEWKLAKAKNRIAELEEANRWIPIANGRLPEKFQMCLVLDSAGNIHEWTHDDALLPTFAKYTHWMPKPLPPEREAD